jgi:hypothetical protein
MPKVKDFYQAWYDRAIEHGNTPKAADIYAESHRFDNPADEEEDEDDGA